MQEDPDIKPPTTLPAPLADVVSLPRAVRFGALLLAVLVAGAAFAAPTFADHPEGESDAGISAVVSRSAFTEPDAHLAHNVSDLRVTVGDDEVDCNFLAYYDATGGVTRWGFATSEVIIERPGTLTQYYQRGVVDCQARDGRWRLERRLAWDHLGGGLGGAPDLGVEPDLISEQDGLPLGPWGHRVSNFAVDGAPTGFLDVFVSLGGLEAFGLPKTDARRDDHPGAMLGIEGADPGVTRQYFQAAVFEHRPDSAEPVRLRLLGDAVRDRAYPFGSHQVFSSFRSAQPLRRGQRYVPEGASVRDALAALYEATDGANWNNHTNWLSDAPLGEWYGVTTDDHGRVVELDLSQNQLSGAIPAAVGRLTNLTRLSLWGNQLDGELPAELGFLANVTLMSFWNNHLSGEIPASLGNLTKLEALSLTVNNLSGAIPAELGRLTNLEFLYVSQNRLQGEIPAEIGRLAKLRHLNLKLNRLEGEIPPELGRLANLEQLTLSGNRLHGEIPAALGRLVSLEWLDLESNQLRGEIPSALGDLTNLRWLYLAQNHLTGAIPTELGHLANLRALAFGGNQLTGCIPVGLQDVPETDFSDLGLPICGGEG